MNHIESSILKQCGISKACYHAGGLENNDIHRTIAQGCVILLKLDNALRFTNLRT